MGKGKKKTKGKKKNGGKKVREDTEPFNILSVISQEQKDIAIAAAANRTKDLLKNWTRVQNDEECPICMLPLPLHPKETLYCVTCGKTVCMGCMVSAGIVHRKGGGDRETAIEKARTCPYCRSDTASYDDQYEIEKEMKRANAGNHDAMFHLGEGYCKGEKGLRQDKVEGLKWYHRAVESGSGKAANDLGQCYLTGDGVEQDNEKALQYYQLATDLGWIPAFYPIGLILVYAGEIEEGMLNFRKAAMCGITMCDGGITMGGDPLFRLLRDGFRDGFITKDEYAFTLREHQKACNEMKSEARDKVSSFVHITRELLGDAACMKR